MEVCKLSPAVMSNIWGGTYFKQYGKGLDKDIVAELWELSSRDNDSSVIASGVNKGKKLSDVLTEEDVGPCQSRFKYFPLLVKLIDAKDNLSVQVHPSDDYALKYENSFGKSEMWHIISSDEGCGLYVGLNDNYSKEQIEEHLKDGTILSCLNFYHVKPGDTYVIDPGTIHAIGKGVRLIEIQQNSNLTYRLFDYNRVDKFGNPRELHIEKALKVINYAKYNPGALNSKCLADNQYFTVLKDKVDGEKVIKANEDSFVTFTFLSGEGTVNDICYKAYDTFFVPYYQECLIKGNGEVIISKIRK